MLYDFFTAHIGLLKELWSLFLAIAVIITAAGIAIARFDRIPLEDAMYLAFITAFTVGFGDVTPRSRGARVACVVLSFVGLVAVGILVAVAAHALETALGKRTG